MSSARAASPADTDAVAAVKPLAFAQQKLVQMRHAAVNLELPTIPPKPPQHD